MKTKFNRIPDWFSMEDFTDFLYNQHAYDPDETEPNWTIGTLIDMITDLVVCPEFCWNGTMLSEGCLCGSCWDERCDACYRTGINPKHWQGIIDSFGYDRKPPAKNND